MVGFRSAAFALDEVEEELALVVVHDAEFVPRDVAEAVEQF